MKDFAGNVGGEHPRARGENKIKFEAEKNDEGTSPRTRGKRVVSTRCSVMCGNIPAHAGKTAPEGLCPRGGQEHPRARGENPY